MQISISYKFHSLQFPFLADSTLSFFTNFTLCQNLPFSFHSLFLANSIPCKVRRPVIMCGEYMLVCFNSGDVSCYPASMVNFFWCSDEKMFIVSALCNMGAWNQAYRNPKTQPSCKLCTVSLEGAKVKLSSPVRESNRFGHFCGCNSKTSTVCHQQTR